MRHRTLDEMISYASQQLDQMDIKQEYKMKLLGMMTAIGCEVKDCAWIPCSERLPEDCEDVLCWYEYFRYGDYNCMFHTYGVGFYDHTFKMWGGDVSGHEMRVIAWMPLPEPYREVEHERS